MKIGVSAITGKMGQVIAQMVLESPIVELKSGLVRQGNNFENADLGEIFSTEKSNNKITSDIDLFVKSCDAIIDFSSPNLSLELAQIVAKHNKILVCGTTGFSDSEKMQLKEYAKNAVIIWSSNMSVGINLLMNLVEKTAAILRDDYDIEIVEMHHRNKVDAPSGTALSLGLAAAEGRNIDLQASSVMSRFGNNAKRKKGEIGFATLRGGDVIGDHSVIFAGDGERIELSHKATNRNVFASGAIRAAIWGSGKQNGFYLMKDVLS